MNARQTVFMVVSLLALTLTAHIGCSPSPPIVRETAKVSGHVTYGGKPILNGNVLVYIEGGWSGSGVIEDGEYVIPDAPVGSVHVVVSGSIVMPVPGEDLEKKKWADINKFKERAKKLRAEGKSIEDEQPEPLPEDPNAIPHKYGGDFTTPLVREVKPGEQVIDIDIPKE